MEITIRHVISFDPTQPPSLSQLSAAVTDAIAPLMTAFTQLGAQIMAFDDDITKTAADLAAKVDATATRVTTEVATLNTNVTTLTATVAELQSKIDNHTASPAEVAALASIQASLTKLDQIDPATPSVLPPTPPVAPPVNPPVAGA